MNTKPERERITLCTKKDFEVSYFCGSGAGGQARNKVASGVQIKHPESGAIGRASDSRSQADNKKNAFLRLTKTAQFKFWIAKRMYEIDQQETIEQTVEKETRPNNLKFEIQENGKWIEVPDSYFQTPAAKGE